MIEFPNIIPQSMTCGLSSNSKVFESVFNKSTSAVKFAGSSIVMSMTYDSLDRGETYDYDEYNDLETFLFELDGMSGIAKIPLFYNVGAPAKGTPVISVADQLGGSISTNGWNPNQLVIKRGEFITINNELKKVMSNVMSDATGNATITIAPWLRSSPEVGTPIITENPYGLFRLTDDENQMDITAMNGGVTLSFKEAFYV